MAGTVYVDGVSVGSFTPETQGTTGDDEVDTVDIGDFNLGTEGFVYVNSIEVGTYTADYTVPSGPQEDTRYRTKVWLTTHLAPTNLTKDDDVTVVDYAVMYANPNYSINKEFRASSNPVDLLYVISKPTSELKLGVRYTEHIPITIFTIDKYGITGTKLAWKAEEELRRICETYAHGSYRIPDRIGDNEERLGSTTLYSTTLMLEYTRTSARGKA